jgi:hypothetical protein
MELQPRMPNALHALWAAAVATNIDQPVMASLAWKILSVWTAPQRLAAQGSRVCWPDGYATGTWMFGIQFVWGVRGPAKRAST